MPHYIKNKFPKTESVIQAWNGHVGQAYFSRIQRSVEKRDRSTLPIVRETVTESFRTVLAKTRNVKTVLEVGSGLGHNLKMISTTGEYLAVGIDPVLTAICEARQIYPNIPFAAGTAFSLPFRDNTFDFVFTRMVLIHIHPEELANALSEIIRVSRHYVCGMEYHADTITPVSWRSEEGLLWKQDFERAYLNQFPKLTSPFSKILPITYDCYQEEGLAYKHFLLKQDTAGKEPYTRGKDDDRY